MSEAAILNANYMKEMLKDTFKVATEGPCMHEFVLSLKSFGAQGVHAGRCGQAAFGFRSFARRRSIFRWSCPRP